MGEELGCLPSSPTASSVGTAAVLACSCAVSTGYSVDVLHLIGFGMTGRMAVVRSSTMDRSQWFSTNHRIVEGSYLLVATKNLSRCTTHKHKINGDDCGRGRDNDWSCSREDMFCIDRQSSMVKIDHQE